MRTYIQYYQYDEVGNMTIMKHTTTGGTGNWTRDFTIDTASNRTTANSIGSNNPVAETYTFDLRGNIVGGFNHLTSLAYNDTNMMEVVVDASGDITTYYQYDYQGQRARKVTIDTSSNFKYSRKYFGQWEVYQKIDIGTNTLTLERESLSVTDNGARIALIDTPTVDTVGTGDVQLLRYQYSNHLSTATLELDDSAAVITYEEYYPFGSTSFQSGRSAAEVSLKRYRFTGKERDDESGFYYHGARYYVPWLARWIAVDPLEIKFSPESPYNYGHNNPITWQDSTGMQAETHSVPVTTTDTSGNVTHTTETKDKHVVSITVVHKAGSGKPAAKPAGKETDKKETDKKETGKKETGEKKTGTTSSTTSSSTPLRIGGSLQKGGEGEDFTSGNEPEPKDIDVRKQQEETNSELLEDFEDILTIGTFGTGDDVAKDMIKHFGTKSGKDYSNIELTKIMAENQQVKNLGVAISEAFNAQMKANKGDFSKINIVQNKLPAFSFKESPTLKTLVGGTQQLDIYLNSIQINKDGTYSAQLSFTLHDDFGVSKGDIAHPSFAASLGISGLKAMWVLQHQRGFKPFQTLFHFNIKVHGKF